MKSINWNQMSKLGLVERINREILHPLGLAVSRTVKTGTSECVLVADDGVWEYASEMQTTIISDEEVKAKLLMMPEIESIEILEGWILVSEKLPPKEKNGTSIMVDVFDGEERWPFCYYCFINEEWIWNETGESLAVDATHWMEIKLPKVEM
ncbi:DUF551 domain-containing protein [Vibrio anguillarum]|uniref:DUF7415 domain-containing protein n=1 Tax=Vibrio anguillarum TaxID=55601 RepID=UPI001652A6FC|nr:DUF551 domain-containing protein [Vibrio anguillarum]